ncbi:RNA-directed DNA polymerase, eukaryota, reverse transcriptase zinc-binding domain protein [Tanacetum coccineum]
MYKTRHPIYDWIDQPFHGRAYDKTLEDCKEGPLLHQSCEAEYIAATSCVCQAIWLRSMLKELHMEQEDATEIYVDNKSAIDLAKNPVYHDRKQDGIQQLEDMDLIQKARVKWDVEGDENTKFFHGILKQKRFYQSVQGIMIDGEWVTNPHQVKSAFYNFFKDKFDVSDSLIELSPVILPSTLSQNDNLELEKPVYVEEI